MKKADFYFALPDELIAQDPLSDRSSSRLLVLNKHDGKLKHDHFFNLLNYLRPGDCLVLNNTKVIPARLTGTKSAPVPETADAVPGGAAIEVLLLKRRAPDLWETLVKPGKKARPGARLTFGDGRLTGEVLAITAEGNRMIRFAYQGIFEEILDALGEMPLPPYITHKLADQTRYQTVYAQYDGSAAAPTAGLHFTDELLAQLPQYGIRTAYVTLHVGLGTFRPVKTERITDHHMHSEDYEISPEAAAAINETKRAGGRIICVGTTSCRTLESAALPGEQLLPAGPGQTDIFIYPGYQFKVVDGLITNFHLPESTLIMLVSALAGREAVLAAYQAAIDERYRFFSFGDAMLIQ